MKTRTDQYGQIRVQKSVHFTYWTRFILVDVILRWHIFQNAIGEVGFHEQRTLNLQQK